MQAQTNVFPVQTQVVGQTQVVPVQNTATNHLTNRERNAATGVRVIEITFRVLCTAFSFGVLIVASVAVQAINEVAEVFDSVNYDYDAESYRGAAGWLIFVACASIIYHIAMIIVRILHMASVIKQHLKVYTLINGILIVLFGLSFLSGGIANVIYASDNDDLHTDLCLFIYGETPEFCSDLVRVTSTEAASGILSFFTLIFHGMLLFSIICTAICIGQCSQRTTYSTQPHYAISHQPTHLYTPMNTSQYVPPPQPSYLLANPPSQYASPSAPYYPPTNVPSHMLPGAPVQPPASAPSYTSVEPPSYTSAEPPSYESVVTSQYKLSSGDPPGESKTGIIP